MNPRGGEHACLYLPNSTREKVEALLKQYWGLEQGKENTHERLDDELFQVKRFSKGTCTLLLFWERDYTGRAWNKPGKFQELAGETETLVCFRVVPG